MDRRAESIVLGLSAFAPAGIVHALSYLPTNVWAAALIGGLSLGIGGLTVAFLRKVHKRGREALPTTQIKPITGDAFALFLTYALPLITALNLKIDQLPSIIALCLFLLLILTKSRFITSNPLLIILGYSAFEAESKTGVTYVILRKGGYRIEDTTLSVTRLNDICFLEVEDGEEEQK